MQKIEIVYDEALEAQVLMLLRQAGVEHYTKLDDVKGVGGAGAKFNTAVGPGVNCLLFAVVEDARVAPFRQAFERFKKVQGEHAGAIMMASPVNDMV